MEKMDQELQKRVWQRVQNREGTGTPHPARENIRPWMMAAQENAAVYRQLSRQLSGRSAEQLRRLEQESMRGVACIKGLCRLRGENATLPPQKPGKEPVRRALEKCYYREHWLWEEAERRSYDPEYGPVFRQLTRQTGEHCAVLAEILGRTG